MAIFLQIITALKLALEIFKTIKGVPNDGKRDAVKTHLLEKTAQIRTLSDKGSESGDYTALETYLNRPTGERFYS